MGSYGEVIILAMTEFFDSGNLIPIPQYQHLFGIRLFIKFT